MKDEILRPERNWWQYSIDICIVFCRLYSWSNLLYVAYRGERSNAYRGPVQGTLGLKVAIHYYD